MLGVPWALAAQVQLGNEGLAAGGFKELLGKRVGLITNPSGINRRGDLTIDVLRRARGVRLVALFAPEHGLYGHVAAGRLIEHRVDPPTGLPVYSLYGATRKPTPAMLKGLDALVYDLQDTGVRSYTFISTLGLAMEACAEAGLEFVVLDRPNPLGGERVEGPMVEPAFRSFISQWDVPYLYGLTCGELARMINGEGWIRKRCRLTVVPLKGWRRSMVWSEADLPWVPPSPSIPGPIPHLFNAATGLFGEIAGGSGINIGNAIRRPFECVSASWLDAARLRPPPEQPRAHRSQFPILNVNFEGRRYKESRSGSATPPTPRSWRSTSTCIEAVRRIAGRTCSRKPPAKAGTSAFSTKPTAATRSGKRCRLAVQPRTVVKSWKRGRTPFRQRRERYLLYRDGQLATVQNTATAPATAAPIKEIRIPDRTGHLFPPSATPLRCCLRATSRVVTVSKKDTLTKIARDFGVSSTRLSKPTPARTSSVLGSGRSSASPRTRPLRNGSPFGSPTSVGAAMLGCS